MTYEERREAQEESLRTGFSQAGDAAYALSLLMAHFDTTEPAVADAIRYGLVNDHTWTYTIDYPDNFYFGGKDFDPSRDDLTR